MRLYIIIPAYNEEKHLAKVISGVKKYSKNIIVVDDGSKDNNFRVAKEQNVVVLKHIVNLGKGAAMKTGAEYSLKHGADSLIFIDSDGQHDPSDIPRFLNELKNADIVFGSRKRTGNMPFVFRFGNWFISFTSRLLFGIDIHDTQSGFRAMTSETYKRIKWASTGYSVESEMIALAGKNKLKYKEIFIKTVYSDKYKGTTVFDGIKIVLNMFKWRLTL
jgi:glycosyltransferase involved in cell wall biosynthesis